MLLLANVDEREKRDDMGQIASSGMGWGSDGNAEGRAREILERRFGGGRVENLAMFLFLLLFIISPCSL